MKQPAKVDFSSHQKLEEIIEQWRDVVGVDRVYLIELIESPESGPPAWVDGLTVDNTHPLVHIFINAGWIQKHKHNEKEVVAVIIHELIHIVLWEQLIQMDPTYTYTGLKARANEILTMKMTNAIIQSYYEPLTIKAKIGKDE